MYYTDSKGKNPTGLEMLYRETFAVCGSLFLKDWIRVIALGIDIEKCRRRAAFFVAVCGLGVGTTTSVSNFRDNPLYYAMEVPLK